MGRCRNAEVSHVVLHKCSGHEHVAGKPAHLVSAAFHALGSRLLGVDIVDLRANTFYAQLRLTPPNGSDPGGADEILVDARPSDALALAPGPRCF